MRSNQPASQQSAPADTKKSRGDSVNQVILIGCLVAAPELRETASGKHVTTFRIATNGRKNAEFHESSSGRSSRTSRPPTLARNVSSKSRAASRPASGRPPTAAPDALSRSSPAGSRRSPRAHRSSRAA
jgi:Single-strand binding protein family